MCKVKCAAGLAELNSKRYKSAAKYFLATTFENFNFNDVILSLYYIYIEQSKLIIRMFYLIKIITPNNVAIYGSLCALATYDRRELQTHVIQSR